MRQTVLLLVPALAVAFLVGACRTQAVGDLQRETHTIQPETVSAHLTTGAGELKVSGAADALMEGDFTYNVADWKPKVDYDVLGDTGELSVAQGSGEGIPFGGNARNEWDLRFNDQVPTNLVVDMGAGESDLDLDSLNLKGLNLNMGRARPRWTSQAITVGALTPASREATVLLPSEVGIRVTAEGGLGKINADGLSRDGEAKVNDVYGDSDVNLDVVSAAGSGRSTWR